jgi:hypothetical protein
MGKRKMAKESEIFFLSGYITKENIDNEKYPPFLEFHIMRHVAFCLSIEVQSDLEVSPTIKETIREIGLGNWWTYFSEWARASATYALPVFFFETGESTSASCTSLLPRSLWQNDQSPVL